MYKDKKTKEIKSFAYLTRKICDNIPNDFYNNLDEKYGLTNIYMLRPYRLNDGYIGLVTTNNIDDYYIVPKGVNIVKCNGSGTTILTMNHNETKKTYYAFEDTSVIVELEEDSSMLSVFVGFVFPPPQPIKFMDIRIRMDIMFFILCSPIVVLNIL